MKEKLHPIVFVDVITYPCPNIDDGLTHWPLGDLNKILDT